MSRTDVAINSDYNDLGWREDAGERAWLLQSPSVESEPKSDSKEPRGGTSSIGAVFIVVNAALGAGLLNFPAAFNTAGGVTCGVVLQMCMLVFIIAGLVVLAYCSQVSNESTYQEVVRAVCGRVPGVLCDVAIAVYTFGTCIAFLIIIGDQLDKRESSPRDHHQAFNCVIQYLKPVRREELAPRIDYAMQFNAPATCLPAVIGAMAHESEGEVSTSWYTDRKFTISLTSILLILPLSIPKEIGFQKYASALSVIGTWYVTIVIIIKYIWPDKEITPGYIPTSPSSWTAVFNAMPTICFGFQCHVSSVPVFNSMKRPEIRPWVCVVTVGMIICLFVYTGTGVCGFLTFGSNVNQDVLLSYPSNDIPVAVARAFIVVCVLTSYPILHFCGRAVLEGLWLRFRGEPVEVDVTRERRRRVLQTVVWFSLTLLLALFIPDIGRVISLIGGLAACFIFIFPGLCLIQAKLSEIQEVKPASWWALVSYGIFMVTLGAFIFGQTTTNAIYRDVIHQNTE